MNQYNQSIILEYMTGDVNCILHSKETSTGIM